MTLEQALEIAENPTLHSEDQQKKALALLTAEKARRVDAALHKLKTEDW